jgi:N-acetylmuramoyl-L-alanine amidase
MRRAALALLAATGALWATASAAKDGEAPTVALRLSDRSIPFGREVVARGRVSPAEQGMAVVVEQQQRSSWIRVATAQTVESGAFSARFAPRRGGPVRARLVETGATSPGARLGVRPLVRVSVEEGRAFLGAKARIRTRPATYDGRVVAHVFREGKRVGAARGRADGGSLRLRLPTPGVGRFRVRLVLAGTDAFDRVRASGSATADAIPLAYGAAGREVRALLRRLKELRYHVPEEKDAFGVEAMDAVLAFEKAEGLARDGAVGEDVWAALGRARPPKPRYRKPALHIEVDKARQILMVVRDGKTKSVVSVSTGASGNTPEGAFRIRWKAPATTTWLGPAILYRTLTFLGNEYAIHGYPSVPAYPASHGCVRVPMWVADWLYQRSPVGERVYVYH